MSHRSRLIGAGVVLCLVGLAACETFSGRASDDWAYFGGTRRSRGMPLSTRLRGTMSGISRFCGVVLPSMPH